MERVILETPFKGKEWGDTEENIKYARLCVRDGLLRDEAPYASHLLYTQEGIFDDKILNERNLGIDAGFAWKEIADKTVVYINRGISKGMHFGIKKSISLRQEIEYRILVDYPKKIPVIVTITGASGVGKSTIIKRFLEKKLDAALIKSFTTRAPRDSDLPGEYNCNISHESMHRLEKDFFKLFSAHGNFYGTLKGSVTESMNRSNQRIMILVPEAVMVIRDFYVRWEALLDQIISFYILSPGEEELRSRLSGRGEAEIQRRIDDCKKWDEAALSSDIPYIFLSNNTPDHIGVERAIQQMLVFF